MNAVPEDAEAIVGRLQRAAEGLPTFTAYDLQRMHFPPIGWVVPQYVCEGLTILAGKPKLGKSWLALDWGLAVAFGGVACGSIDCEEGDVLYAALEDNKRRLQRRCQQMLAEDADWPRRLELMTELPRLDQGGIETLQRWAERAERPRLVILDTLACVRPLRSGKENGYDSDYAALSGLQAFAGRTGLAIVIVHHVRKMDSDDPLDTVSGTTGLTGCADTVLVLNRDSQGVTLYGRGRDIDEVETAMSFDKTTGRWTVLGAAGEVRRSDERNAIVSAMLAAGEPMSPSAISVATGMKAENVRFLLHRMVKDGEISKVGRGSYGPP